MRFVIYDSGFPGMALYNISLNYQRLEKLPRAVKCAREALRIWQTSLPPGHEDIMDSMNLVRHLEQEMGLDDASVRRSSAYAGGDKEHAIDHPSGGHVPYSGQTCSASAHVVQSVSVPSPVPVLTEEQLRAQAASCNEAEGMDQTQALASVLLDQGKLNEALAMFEKVLEYRRRVLPEDHPDIGEGHVRRDALIALC
jgi:tetratricopeptide (TPR) repeat protein